MCHPKKWSALLATGAALALSGCGAAVRFRDAAPVWQVDDARDIPEPEEREYSPKKYFAEIFLVERLDRTLQLRDEEPAWNTNSLDEVPNSTWFQNRIGARRLSPAEAARGPDTGGPPQPPLVIVQSKVAGGNPGFIAKDKTGRRFIVKFDTLENPEMQTAAGVLVNRIFWTLGYNVPSDHVFTFRREDLSVEPGAVYKDVLKREHPLDWPVLDAILRTSPRQPNGAYRAFASQFLPGKPKGGFPPEGVRDDDPNDRVPHEHRRELRGLRVFAAWVGHTDMKEDNTLDVYVEENGRRFLRHYLLDFGEALDAHAAEKGRPEDGWEHYIDWGAQLKATFAFGLWKRPWEDTRPTRWASVGSFSARLFDPVQWREAYPYWPFFETDASDAYWAAKLVMRFDRATLAAIVGEGKFSDPEAAAYVVETLYARRTAIGRAYLEAVSPLDEWTVGSSGICAIDLGVFYGLATGGSVERLQGSRVVDSRSVDSAGRVCLPLPASETYTVYRLRVRRGSARRPPLEVHLIGGQSPRVVGIERIAP
jgi:hypothetical protein